MGKEKKMWEVAYNVSNKVPRMNYMVKVHKEPMGVRNICPRDGAISFGVSKILAGILEEVLRDGFDRMEFKDINVKDVIKWTKEIEGMDIKEDERRVSVDLKEMFNNIDRGKLMKIISMNVDERKYNRETILEMVKYDIYRDNLVMDKGMLYEQCQGVAMGQPSSAIYAKIYVDVFINIRWKELEMKGIRCMAKNVDIWMVVKGDKWKDVLEQMGKEIVMEWTVEEEDEEGKVNFYDMQMIHDKERNKIRIRKFKKKYVSMRMVHKLSGQDKGLKR